MVLGLTIVVPVTLLGYTPGAAANHVCASAVTMFCQSFTFLALSGCPSDQCSFFSFTVTVFESFDQVGADANDRRGFITGSCPMPGQYRGL